MAKLSISLFGNIEIALDGIPVTFQTDKALALFVYLAIESDRNHRRDALAGYLWPDQPQENALQNLRQAFTQLRRALGNDEEGNHFLIVDRQMARFNTASDHWIDIAEYRSLNAACKNHRHRKLDRCLPCFQRCKQMSELYRGEFFAQFSASDTSFFNDWVWLVRESLHRSVFEVLDVLIGVTERQGDASQSIEYAWRQVAHDPWREESYAVLMELLAADGQRSAALAQYDRCRAILHKELSVEPARRTTHLYTQIKDGTFTKPDSQNVFHETWASCTTAPFVGRKGELDQVAEWISDPDRKLITIMGPGGVGKSRLAFEVARSHRGIFVDGVAFISLIDVQSSATLIPSIASAIHMNIEENCDIVSQLSRFLQGKELLLVLDNLDHLVDHLEDLNTLIQRVSNVVFVVTSRERLRLQEEWVFPLEGLEYPADDSSLANTSMYSAMTLFDQRASQVYPGFCMEKEAQAVAEICRMVEGLPLAIELSAAWMGLRSCQEIAAELKQNLTQLSSPYRNALGRHSSLWAAFEISWAGLLTEEQDIFERLSVFRGGFTAAKAMEITRAKESHLSVFAGKSMLRCYSSGRYELHEILRQFSAIKLDLKPAVKQHIIRRHANVFAQWFLEQTRNLIENSQQAGLDKVSIELENLHEAWLWLIENGSHDQLEPFIDGLYEFHSTLGRFESAVNLFEAANHLWCTNQELRLLWAKLRSRQAAFYYRLGRYKAAETAIADAYPISLELNQRSQKQFCLLQLALIRRAQGHTEQAREYAAQVLDLAGQNGGSDDAVRALYLLGVLQVRSGNIEQGRQKFLEGLGLAEKRNYQRLRLVLLNALGDTACYKGDYYEAKEIFDECCRLSQQIGDRFHHAIHLNNLGTVYHHLEQYEEADRLYASSLSACRNMGDRAGQAIALSNRGEIALLLNNYDQAEQCFSEGLEIADTMGDATAAIVCLNNLGKVHYLNSRLITARGHFHKALRLTVEAQAWSFAGSILLNAAELLIQEGQNDQAAALLQFLAVHETSEADQQVRAAELLSSFESGKPEKLTSLEESANQLLSLWGEID